MKFALLVFLFGISGAVAQLPSTDLHRIVPFSGKAGETTEITVSGLNTDFISALRFSDPRIVAEPILKPADELVPEPAAEPNRFRVITPPDVEPVIVEVRALGQLGLSTARPFFVAAADSIEISDEPGKQQKAEDQLFE